MADEFAKIVLGDTAISAIEGTPGRRWFRRKKDQDKPLTHCENCGAELQGHWCAHCGQPAIDYRRSFRHVIADLLDEFLNWDSKFFATIALLIFKPWRLTNEFLAGKRVRYANPLRLYLLASILFFFAVNYGARAVKFEPGKIGPKDRAELRSRIKEGRFPTCRERAIGSTPTGISIGGRAFAFNQCTFAPADGDFAFTGSFDLSDCGFSSSRAERE